MAKITIDVDTTELGEVLGEIERLCARIASPPKHVEARVERIRAACKPPVDPDTVRVEGAGGKFVVRPGSELLCLLVDLRVLAGER